MPRSRLFKTHKNRHDDNANTEAINFPSGSLASPSKASVHFPPSSPSFELTPDSHTIGSVDHDKTPTIVVHGTDFEPEILPMPEEASSLGLIKSIAKRASIKRLRSISGVHASTHRSHYQDSSDTSLSSSTSYTSSISTTSNNSTNSADTSLSPPSHHRTRLLSLPSFHRRSRTSGAPEQGRGLHTSNLAPSDDDEYLVPPSQRSFQVLSRPRRTQSQIVTQVEKNVEEKREPGSETETIPVAAHAVLCYRCGSNVHNDTALQVSKEYTDSLDLKTRSTDGIRSESPVVPKSYSDTTSLCSDITSIPVNSESSQDSSSNIHFLDSVQTSKEGLEAEEAIAELSVNVITELDPTITVKKAQDIDNDDDTTDVVSLPSPVGEVSSTTDTSLQQNTRAAHLNPLDEEEIIPPFLFGPYILDELAMPILSGTRPFSFFFCRIFLGSLWRDLWYGLTRMLQVHLRRRISVYLTWWLSRVPFPFSRPATSKNKA
ncbi:hypothetical protein J3R30DRAFT_3506385 [Lentinula aciculospora]|uniref:Uncharacterized protein n=1 Tax=Lentinula aciculospora TaxID=153920 RepID=A0A9W9A5I4_9AGAR|nr:hypothetical protein J3R30DRAFT_3506385 [Lentinula aciculospora]